jgi:hypothetical protein
MRQLFVIDPLIGKRQQLLLATQLCRMVLKVRNSSSVFGVLCLFLFFAFFLPFFFLIPPELIVHPQF